ncbi:hypothetical protein H0H92_012317 [Tricholoma furcatifolium]|nr:hypothetical protein H0H92_012317 [Tricholoma furcatifolium]
MDTVARAASPDGKVSQQILLAEDIAFNKVTDTPPIDQDIIIKDWNADEEAAVRRKIDFILIPILALAFFSLQMDRGNISAVLISTITKDLEIDTNQINVGTQLLSAGIVLSEIPSNIILQRIGPRVWLSGALYYLSTWYTKNETSSRIALFFYGQMFALATSSLISAGLLDLSGLRGLEGWRWIFLVLKDHLKPDIFDICIVEGIITLFSGILFTLLIPPKAGDGYASIAMGQWSYFSERESHIIRSRVLLDDPLKARGHIQISRSDIWQALKQLQILQHVLLTLVAMSGFLGLAMYTPSLIKSLGFSASRANVLASVPTYGSIVWVTILAFAADYTGHRGPFVLISIAWNVISYACLRVTPRTASRQHRYGVLVAANISGISMQYVHRDESLNHQ